MRRILNQVPTASAVALALLLFGMVVRAQSGGTAAGGGPATSPDSSPASSSTSQTSTPPTQSSPTQSSPTLSSPTLSSPTPPGRRPSVLPPGDRMAYMQTVSAALGVDCGYCHGGRGGNTPATAPLTVTGKPRVEVAREMFLMVDQINATVQQATGKATADATRVTCATCHRGVPIPMQIGDIMWQTATKQGAEAAVAQYRELRARFYGRQAYDFGEPALIPVTERLANVRPDAAVALLRMNLDFHPESVQSRISLAYALTRGRDYQGAIAALKDALALDPTNGVAKGMLAQLER